MTIANGQLSKFWPAIIGGCTNYFAWGTPNRRPIAIQSRSHRVQLRSNVGHRCCFCIKFRCLISSAGLLPYTDTDTGKRKEVTLVELVQSLSNRRPIKQLGKRVWPCANKINIQTPSNCRPFAARVLPIAQLNKLPPLFINFRHAMTDAPT